MFDSKNDLQAGLRFSNLSDEDIKTISEAEQKLSQNRSAKLVLIAYDNAR